MRIAFFVYEYPPAIVGGLGTYAQYITREFVRLGHDVSVFTLNPGNLKTHEVVGGVTIHRPLIADAARIFPIIVSEDLRRWGTNLKYFSDMTLYNILGATKFVNQVVKREGVKHDVVCVHDWLSSTAGLIVKQGLDVPVAFHVHSTEWGRSGNTGSDVVNHLETTMAEEADQIVTVSEVMRGDLARHGWNERKIAVVWNGIDPDVYDPSRVDQTQVAELKSKYGLKGDDAMVLFVGRLSWYKGIRSLVLALPQILQKHPSAKLVILGRGEEQKAVTEIAENLGINGRIAGRYEFVSEEERILHYAAADVCVFPSTYEPFGIVSLEAMAMKKPVVVGAKGVVGFKEQVVPAHDGQTGLHVNGEDPADIAWGVNTVLDDPERARLWGENGRKRVLNLFTWRLAAERTLKVYQRLAK